MADDPTLKILIDIRTRLEELAKARSEIRGTKEEAEGFGALLKQGLGIGTGMELARRGIELVKDAIVDTTREAFRLAGELKDTSQNLGISTEALQVLGETVKDNGGDMQTLTQAIVHYRETMEEVRRGNKDTSATFRQLGLDVDQLATMPVEQQLEHLAKAIHNAGDESQAFDLTVKIFGSRTAPKFTQTLREIGEQGYGGLAKAIKESGRVMQEETIERLDRAQKQIEKFKHWMTIQTGEMLGAADQVKNSFTKDFWGTLWASLANVTPAGSGLFAATVALNQPTPAPTEKKTLAPAMADRESVLLAQIARSQQAAADITGNPALTELKQRSLLLPVLQAQVKLYHELEELKFPDSTQLIVKAAGGQLTEAELARFREFVELRTKMDALDNAATAAAGGQPSRFKRSKEAFESINRKQDNPEYLSPTEGLQAGVMEWATQVGSVGQQVASSLQGILGGTVSNISMQLTQAITKTESWGEALQNIWQSFGIAMIQALVQMVAQWAVSKAAMFAIDMAFQAKSLALSIAAAAKSFIAWLPSAIAASISSFGTAAVVGSVAALAAFAAFGGFRERGGPAERGRAYVVGERRAEVFEPTESGTIYPSVDAYVSARRGGVGGMSTIASGGGAGMAVDGKPRVYLALASSQEQFDEMKRLPGYEVHHVDMIHRNRGTLLNS